MIRALFFILLMLPLSAKAGERCPSTISIGGAITEIVYKLGKEHCLVGADTTSTYPAEAKTLPMVGYQRQLSSEGILSLKPELILHTDQAGPLAVLKQIDQAGIKRVVIDDTHSLEAVFEKIRIVAKTFNIEEKGEAIIADLQSQSRNLASKIFETSPKVLFIMQHGGGAPMAGGKDTAADGIITLAGGQNILEFEGYKPLTPEAFATLNPDMIVTTQESLAQIGGIDGLMQIPGMHLTKAGKDKNIITMDALLILGFGPRTVQAAQELSDSFQKVAQ
jgi:iron complex transport system substrate-binding protein